MFWLNHIIVSFFTSKLSLILIIPFLFLISFLVVWLLIAFEVQRIFKLHWSSKQVLLLAVIINGITFCVTLVFGWGALAGIMTPLVKYLDFISSTVFFNYFNIYPPIVPIFIFIFLPLIFVPVFLLTRLLLWNDFKVKHLFSATLMTFIFSLTGSVITFFSILGIVIGYFLLSENMCYREMMIFHEFNQHLKTLCVESADKSECPRNEEELMAFNKQNYQRLHSCARTAYDFNEESQTATWIVRWIDDVIYISHPEFYPGFGYFHKADILGEIGENYPPQFDGPWEIMK